MTRFSPACAAAALTLLAACADLPTATDATLATAPTAAARIAAAGSDYELVNIGATLPAASRVHALNSHGVVLGTVGDRYFVWTEASGATYLSTPVGGELLADAVNDRGDIAGEGPGSETLWMRWADGSWEQMQFPVAFQWGTVQAMNAGGEVAGVLSHSSTSMSAYTWSSAGGATIIHTACLATPFGISSTGAVVGIVRESCTGPIEGFLWTRDGGYRNLGVQGGTRYSALDVNAALQVVGTVTVTGGTRALVLDAALTPTMPANPFGASITTANGINDAGSVVGSARTTSNLERAVLWSAQGTPTVLESLAGNTVASRIAASGDIGGYGRDASGVFRALYWRMLSPTALVSQASTYVSALADAGTIRAGEANALTVSLDAAAASFDAGNSGAATNQLGAFVNKVGAMEASRRLPGADAAVLRHKAELAIQQAP